MGTIHSILRRLRGVVLLAVGAGFLVTGYPPSGGKAYVFLVLGAVIAFGGVLGIVAPDRMQSQSGSESME